MGHVKDYIKRHYRHFNSAVVIDAAQAWVDLVDRGGKMVLTLGGAMSTAEMGICIADLIREGKVHALCVTGANLEEDLFNLVAHDSYRRIPHYRDLTPKQETELRDSGMNRVTDTCIPEEAAMRKIERHMRQLWVTAQRDGERHFPHEYCYQLIRSEVLAAEYQIDPRDSWLVAASDKSLPIWTPGWEDSTLGNMLVSWVMGDVLDGYGIVKPGVEAMESLVRWYLEHQDHSPIGFFQVGGGLSGDFSICAVPLIEQDLKRKANHWSYFCQISDSTTSYGSYSGAVPNEKITWGKLNEGTPRFVIESDATIVLPLLAAYVLDA